MTITQTSNTVRNRVLYAIASIVRHFPYAQQRFIELGGFSALSTLFQQDSSEKIKLKCVTLITDLVSEQVRFCIPNNRNRLFKILCIVHKQYKILYKTHSCLLKSNKINDSFNKSLLFLDRNIQIKSKWKN